MYIFLQKKGLSLTSPPHELRIKDDDTGEQRFIAAFEKEESLDFVLGLLISGGYRRRELLWEACKS